ncbi:hypothetical protein PNOK_0035400 [Pyrrhoderma noxium]|uniref:Uncharacterized protein n=1 Tax=Pyrrhoderma noxium TaxID=2282107 RepID=A0A286UUK7_9AGAM|nr:hypothetical protein PNOK_0035400 [Pyrrhoderma noxium]
MSFGASSTANNGQTLCSPHPPFNVDLQNSYSFSHVSLPTSVHYREYYFTGHIRSSGLGTIASFSARVVIPLSTQPSTRPRTVSSLGPSSSQSILSRDIIIFKA